MAAPPSTAAGNEQITQLLSQCDELLQGGQAEDALERLRQAHALAPDDLRVTIRLAETHRLLGNRAEGLTALDKVLVAKPELHSNQELATIRRRLEALSSDSTAGPASTTVQAAPAEPYGLAQRHLDVAASARAATLKLAELRAATDEIAAEAVLEDAWRMLRPARIQLDIESTEAWRAMAVLAIGRRDRKLAAVVYEALTRMTSDAEKNAKFIDLLGLLQQLGAREAVEAVRAERTAVVSALPGAVKGESTAVVRVARALIEGKGVPSDLVAATIWLERLPRKQRESARREAASGLASELIAQATRAADSIADRRHKGLALIDVAYAQVAAGDTVAARATFGHAKGAAAGVSDQGFTREWTVAATFVAEAQVEAGDTDGARVTLEDAKRAADGIVEGKVAVWTGIARVQASLGDFDGALQTLRNLVEAGVKDELKVTNLVAAVFAQVLATAGKVEDLTRLANTSEVTDPLRVTYLLFLMQARSASGDAPGARAMIDEARRAAGDLVDTEDKSMALRNVARAQVAAGDVEGARLTLGDAKRAADSIMDKAQLSAALTDVAHTQVAAGDIEGARLTLGDAQRAAVGSTEGAQRSEVLTDLARAQVAAGDIKGARLTLGDAKRAADGIADVSAQLGAWIDIADAQVAAADVEGLRAAAASYAITDGRHHFYLMGAAIAQVIAGDIEGARHTADRITDSTNHYTYCFLALVVLGKEPRFKSWLFLGGA
jgi:tetratricopeptide (TPR) repeat protein